MFCAGADPEHPELRLPSFKGVLRYWWRALAWSRLGGNLGEIQRQENALFGSADSGQSRVLMRLTPATDPPRVAEVKVGSVLTVSQSTGVVVGEGARYLGYGVMEAFARSRMDKKAGQLTSARIGVRAERRDRRPRDKEAGELTRACLHAPFDFTVRMWGRGLRDDQMRSLRDALIALGTLGGMGAKSRKGYGSLVLRSLRIDGDESWHAPQSIDDLRTEISALHRDYNRTKLPDYPEYTAFSSGTRHVLLSSSKTAPLKLLDLVGRELVRFRSWGRDGKILGNKDVSEKNFEDDHDLMKSGRRKTRHPRRIAFGLPHNYGKNRVGPDKGLDRRASPLFIHIHECGSTPVAVLSFLPARFLPKDGKNQSYISVGGSKVIQVPEDDLYRPVNEFLDRLLDRKKRQEPFTEAI